MNAIRRVEEWDRLHQLESGGQSRLVYTANKRRLPKVTADMVKRIKDPKVALGTMPKAAVSASGKKVQKRGPKDDGAWRYPNGVVERAP